MKIDNENDGDPDEYLNQPQILNNYSNFIPLAQ